MKDVFTNGQPRSPSGTQAVHRALSLLTAFTDDRTEWKLTPLAEEVGLNPATVHRILGALEKAGFVARSPTTNAYQLGPEMIVLGARALRSVDLRGIARPELEGLAELTGEEVTLETLAGDEVLILDQIRGRGLLGLGSEVGMRWPVHATATGKVLLAYSGAPLHVPKRGFDRITKNTIVSWDALSAELESICNRGYATNIEELEYGFTAVAAPLLDGDGLAAGAISVGGSVHRVVPDRIPELAKLLLGAASRISNRMGHRGN